MPNLNKHAAGSLCKSNRVRGFACRKKFPRSSRICLSSDYSLIFDQGKCHSSLLLNLHYQLTSGPVRFGLVVSRKVDIRSVNRNRIKRVLREAMRQIFSDLVPGDYVVVVRHSSRKVSNSELCVALLSLLRRIGALPLVIM